MNDKELLERAAKVVNGGAWHPLTHDTPNGSWNPLTDDGDAFRLAVSLNIPLRIDAETEILRNHQPFSLKSDIRRALIRRAIVRAAAAAVAGDACAVPDKSDLPGDNYYKDQAEALYGVEKK